MIDLRQSHKISKFLLMPSCLLNSATFLAIECSEEAEVAGLKSRIFFNPEICLIFLFQWSYIYIKGAFSGANGQTKKTYTPKKIRTAPRGSFSAAYVYFMGLN